MQTSHALLSASSASRWLVCTAAPRFEALFPETTTEYAEEGRVAHAICELKVLRKFTNSVNQKAYTSKLNELKKLPLYSPEMEGTSEAYVDHLVEKAMAYDTPPLVNAEVRVEFAEYVPEGFGTCDCVMIGGDTLDITDYKHGKGVPVSAENNAQMRLYALGALLKYEPFYGPMIRRVRMTVDQPRIQDEPSSETLTVDELKAWGDSIKPIAGRAFSGFGEFKPGPHCRFCRGKAQCRARASAHTALEDFGDCLLPSAENRDNAPEGTKAVLTLDEIGDLLVRGASLVAWFHDLEEFALMAILGGQNIAGWKAVAGRSVRTFSDTDSAIAAVMAAGYDESLVYDRRPKTLTELEKLMGKAEFAEKAGAYVVKPPGKPTLAPMSDKRSPYSSAAADFAKAV